MTATHALYRFYGAGDELLYIGITNNPPRRFRDHDSSLWWYMVRTIRLTPYTSRQELKAAEREAIRSEKPLYNVAHGDPGTRAALEELEDEIESDRFMDEMFAAVAATGITDVKEAIAEYRRRRSA